MAGVFCFQASSGFSERSCLKEIRQRKLTGTFCQPSVQVQTCARTLTHTLAHRHTQLTHIQKQREKKSKKAGIYVRHLSQSLGLEATFTAQAPKQEREQQNRTEVLSLDLAQENRSECLNKGTDEAPSPEGGPGLASIVSLPLARILLA